jgi:hypothetical protein
MLYLHPPFFFIEGVAVSPDSADPTQCWYYPSCPHLAVDEQGRPAIRLLLFKENLDELPPEREDAAGFLFFDTSLAWPEETLQKVAGRLASLLDLDAPPRLSPLLYTGGSVTFSLLDKQVTSTPSGGGPPGGGQPAGTGTNAGPVPTEDWVPVLQVPATPSLYGENRAMLSAQLSKRAAQLIMDSFDGYIPAGIMYDLKYVGLQRAFNIKIEADWSQIYHHLENTFRARVFIFDTDLSKIVEELEDAKLLKITATSEDPEMEGEFNTVRKDLQKFILDNFFKPQPNPFKPDGVASTLSELTPVAWDLRNVFAPAAIGFTRRELNESEIRSFDIDYTVERAVERQIAPQAHLSMFWEDYSLTREQVVTIVDGDDDVWKTVEFSVAANANFSADELAAVAVEVAYGDDSPGDPPPQAVKWAFDLRSGVPQTRKAWYDPDVGRAYKYRYNAVFGPDAVVGQGVQLQSPWRESTNPMLTVSPNELYQIRRLEFQRSKTLPATLFPEVQVHTRYVDPGTGWSHETGGVLNSDTPRFVTELRLPADAPTTMDYRAVYLRVDDDPIEIDWRPTPDELISLQDPRTNLFHVKVLVAGAEQIDRLILNFRYQDSEHNIFEKGGFDLTSTKLHDPLEWVFHRADPARTRYEYNQLILTTDGDIISSDWVGDDRAALPVGIKWAKRWDVRPELVGPPLAINGVGRVDVLLSYHDVANNVMSEQRDTFSATGPGEPWSLQLADPSTREYKYTVTYLMQDGFERRIGPSVSTDTFLVLSSVPPAS